MNLLSEIILTHAWSPIVWKDNYAKTENFLYSDFLALDFDEPGEENLEEINTAFKDHKRIIATTRNHQKQKISGSKIYPPCDRFRLVIPWDKRIESIELYRENYKKVLERFPWVDTQCFDGARFFFPSDKIVYLDRGAEYSWETTSTIITSPTPTFIKSKVDGKIPDWCLNFINNGAVYNGSRNMKVYSVARELFCQGFPERDVRNLLLRAPIDWQGVNLEASIKSAKNKEIRQ